MAEPVLTISAEFSEFLLEVESVAKQLLIPPEMYFLALLRMAKQNQGGVIVTFKQKN